MCLYEDPHDVSEDADNYDFSVIACQQKDILSGRMIIIIIQPTRIVCFSRVNVHKGRPDSAFQPFYDDAVSHDATMSYCQLKDSAATEQISKSAVREGRITWRSTQAICFLGTAGKATAFDVEHRFHVDYDDMNHRTSHGNIHNSDRERQQSPAIYSFDCIHRINDDYYRNYCYYQIKCCSLKMRIINYGKNRKTIICRPTQAILEGNISSSVSRDMKSAIVCVPQNYGCTTISWSLLFNVYSMATFVA